ncbi:MAG TPA: hypothetical protein VF742_02420 [Terracidiphilus sp.]|jgi:hypothetical protein
MNRYMMIRRLRGPAFLLLLGVCALLHQMHLLSFGRAWPLFLILWGVMLLAERAAISQEDMPPYPPPGYPVGPQVAGPVGGVAQTQETGIVPLHGDEIIHRDREEGGEQ